MCSPRFGRAKRDGRGPLGRRISMNEKKHQFELSLYPSLSCPRENHAVGGSTFKKQNCDGMELEGTFGFPGKGISKSKNQQKRRLKPSANLVS